MGRLEALAMKKDQDLAGGAEPPTHIEPKSEPSVQLQMAPAEADLPQYSDDQYSDDQMKQHSLAMISSCVRQPELQYIEAQLGKRAGIRGAPLHVWEDIWRGTVVDPALHLAILKEVVELCMQQTDPAMHRASSVLQQLFDKLEAELGDDQAESQVWLRNELALLSGGAQVEITVDEDAAAGEMGANQLAAALSDMVMTFNTQIEAAQQVNTTELRQFCDRLARFKVVLELPEQETPAGVHKGWNVLDASEGAPSEAAAAEGASSPNTTAMLNDALEGDDADDEEEEEEQPRQLGKKGMLHKAYEGLAAMSDRLVTVVANQQAAQAELVLNNIGSIRDRCREGFCVAYDAVLDGTCGNPAVQAKWQQCLKVERNMYCRLYLALWAVEFQKDCPVLQRHDEFLTVILEDLVHAFKECDTAIIEFHKVHGSVRVSGVYQKSVGIMAAMSAAAEGPGASVERPRGWRRLLNCFRPAK